MSTCDGWAVAGTRASPVASCSAVATQPPAAARDSAKAPDATPATRVEHGDARHRPGGVAPGVGGGVEAARSPARSVRAPGRRRSRGCACPPHVCDSATSVTSGAWRVVRHAAPAQARTALRARAVSAIAPTAAGANTDHVGGSGASDGRALPLDIAASWCCGGERRLPAAAPRSRDGGCGLRALGDHMECASQSPDGMRQRWAAARGGGSRHSHRSAPIVPPVRRPRPLVRGSSTRRRPCAHCASRHRFAGAVTGCRRQSRMCGQ